MSLEGQTQRCEREPQNDCYPPGRAHCGGGVEHASREKVIEQSRRWYATRRDVVEARLKRWGARPEMPLQPKRTRTPRPSMVVNIENYYGGEAEGTIS